MESKRLHSNCAGKDGEGDNGDEPAKKDNNKTEGNVINFDFLDFTVLYKKDAAEAGDPHDDQRPTKDKPPVKF